MDITRYNNTIRSLYDRHKDCLRTSEQRTIPILRRMRKEALSIGDNELLGYVYHSLAFAEYFISGRYDAFLKNLRLATRHLLYCEDQSELMHVYYLVAIDALNKGLSDIAYNYFLTARNIAAETGQETSAAILDENIGHIFLQMGVYAESRRFMKRSLKGIRKDKAHPHYYNNMASCYMNDGEACLQMGLLDQACHAYDKTARFMERNRDKLQPDARFNFVLFGTQIAIVQGNRKLLRKRFSQTMKMIKEITQAANYVNDVCRLSGMLIQAKEYALAGELLSVIEKKKPAEDATDAVWVLENAKAEYYEATGKRRELEKSYGELDRLYQRRTEEQKSIYRFAKDLIHLTGELQRAREEAEKEHQELIRMTETDALCGIPNRHAMNIRMEEAFEAAFLQKKTLGICILDLDGLKAVNDTKGHRAGDRLLQDFGAALSSLARDSRVFAARYGGDEFVLICEGMTKQELKDMTGKLRGKTTASYSMGICNMTPDEVDRPWDFLTSADRALYQVKRAKKAGKRTLDARFIRH